MQVCLFSYGQTGAGKTHTMQGGSRPDAQGIIPRAVAKVSGPSAASNPTLMPACCCHGSLLPHSCWVIN